MAPIRPSVAVVTQKAPAERLRAIPGFSHLPRRVVDRLAQGLSIELAPAKTIIVREGRPQRSLLFLFKGILQQFTGVGSDEATLAILNAPSLAQPHVIYRRATLSTSLRALCDSCIGRVEIRDARELLRDEPKFGNAMIRHVVAELENLLLEHKTARTRNGLERLAAWIVVMQERAGSKAQITLPYDKAVLAARLGVDPATLSRDFARLESYGVTVHGRDLRIGNPALLRTLTAVDSFNAPPVP